MEAALIALLFTVLILAIVVAYVVYRLSSTATIDDLNGVVDEINRMGDSVTGAILRTADDVDANKASAGVLRGLYDDLLEATRTQANHIARNAASNITLDAAVDSAVADVKDLAASMQTYVTPEFLVANGYLQDSVENPFVTTTALGDALSSSDFLALGNMEGMSYGYIAFNDQGQVTKELEPVAAVGVAMRGGTGVTVMPNLGDSRILVVEPGELQFQDIVTGAASAIKVGDGRMMFCKDAGDPRSCLGVSLTPVADGGSATAAGAPSMLTQSPSYSTRSEYSYTPGAAGASAATEAAGTVLVPPSSYSTKAVYTYTGQDQDVAVAGGKVLRAKLWGAGGRGRYGNAPGGAGGYTEAVFRIPKNTTSVRVVVGSAGQGGPGTSSVYGGGGGMGTDNGHGGAGGGGRSAIQILVGGVYKDILTAGGGGGGGEKNGGQYGGAGGGLIGMPAFKSGDSAGTQTRGGTCSNQAGTGNTAGSQYNGGWSTTKFTGGSGGGGYYGGAGAGGPGGYEHRGGGGGSGFVGLDGSLPLSGVEWGSETGYADNGTTRVDSESGVWYTRTKCLRGSGTLTPMKTDPDYANSGDAGLNGRVIIEIS